MTVKCFWCGAINDKASDTCSICSRKLQWSSFFNALLRPPAGCLVGEDDEDAAETVARTPVAA